MNFLDKLPFFDQGTPGTVQQKVAMKLLTNIDVGPARFPMLPMEQEHILELAQDLKKLGIDKFQL